MLSAAGIVRHTHGVLINPESWLQRGYARDAEGNKVSALVKTACKFCLVGALHRCKYELGITVLAPAYQRAFLAISAAAKLRGFKGLIDFNDAPTTTHNDVLDLLLVAETKAQVWGK